MNTLSVLTHMKELSTALLVEKFAPQEEATQLLQEKMTEKGDTQCEPLPLKVHDEGGEWKRQPAWLEGFLEKQTSVLLDRCDQLEARWEVCAADLKREVRVIEQGLGTLISCVPRGNLSAKE